MIKNVVFIDAEDETRLHFAVPAEQFQMRLPAIGEKMSVKEDTTAFSHWQVVNVSWLLGGGEMSKRPGEVLDVHVHLKFIR